MTTVAPRSGPAESSPAGLPEIFRRLLDAYGPQGWWPGDGPWEVMVGAVLTQHTAWANVERALRNLRCDGPITPAGLRLLSVEDLGERLRPAGAFRVKALRLRALLDWCARWDDDLTLMAQADPSELRVSLLSVHGIGPETADAILLYALDTQVFVVDAYAYRVLGRLSRVPYRATYQQLQGLVHGELPAAVEVYQEFHALIVRHGKAICRPRPVCSACALLICCPTGQAGRSAGD